MIPWSLIITSSDACWILADAAVDFVYPYLLAKIIFIILSSIHFGH